MKVSQSENRKGGEIQNESESERCENFVSFCCKNFYDKKVMQKLCLTLIDSN